MLGLFTVTACKVRPLVVCTLLDGTVDTAGICTACTDVDLVVLIWPEDTTMGSVFITIGETVEVMLQAFTTTFFWLFSESEVDVLRAVEEAEVFVGETFRIPLWVS